MATSNKKQRYAATTQQGTPMTIQDTTQQSATEAPAATTEQNTHVGVTVIVDESTNEITDVYKSSIVQDPVQEQVTQTTTLPVSPEVQSTAASEKPVSDFEARVADLKDNGSNSTKVIIGYLEMYIENMHVGKPLDAIQGARYQNQLWSALFNMIQHADDSFEQAFNTVVNFFRQFGTDDVFDERYLFRFAEELPMHQEHRNAFFNLLNLIKLLATTKSRSDVAKQIDIERSIGSVYNDQGRNALHSYLSV